MVTKEKIISKINELEEPLTLSKVIDSLLKLDNEDFKMDSPTEFKHILELRGIAKSSFNVSYKLLKEEELSKKYGLTLLS